MQSLPLQSTFISLKKNPQMCPAHRDPPTPSRPHSRLNLPHPTPPHTYNGLTTFHPQHPVRPFSSIGSASPIQYRSIQTQVNKAPTFHNQALLPKKARGVCRGAAALRPLCGFPFPQKKYCAPFAKKTNDTQYFKKSISKILLLYLTTRTLYIPSISLSSSSALAEAALSRSIRV